VELTLRPIGFVRSPFTEKVQAPRQARVAEGVRGTIEILPEHEHALEDLDGFDRIWVIFWFDRAPKTPVSKILPPRSEKKRGVFATRSPHRPNPIGMSAVRLERVEGCILHIIDIDLLDGTPVLDVKPYIAYADAFPDASMGWLAEDPKKTWEVSFTEEAKAQLEWILERDASVDLRARIEEALALGPAPHPYRRIRKTPEGSVLAVKEWRVRFRVDGRKVVVERIATGYRPKERPEVHRAFVARFG